MTHDSGENLSLFDMKEHDFVDKDLEVSLLEIKIIYYLLIFDFLSKDLI